MYTKEIFNTWCKVQETLQDMYKLSEYDAVQIKYSNGFVWCTHSNGSVTGKTVEQTLQDLLRYVENAQ